MKILQSIVLLIGHLAIIVAANSTGNAVALNQSSVSITTNAEGGQIQSTTVSIDRADLSQPHILRVQGSNNDVPIRMARIQVKINGKVVKTIANNSLELNLAPMMQSGRYEVEISGVSPRLEDTISVNFAGKNTNVTQQFAGAGKIEQVLVINVR
ncbi:hypothetical protein [Chamaesiphon sp. VAR_48_metabat_403]|uniref:hypothetical protein n=1 Tax=Chamaesiphon sp. VAR_48_metabat_403 TaxID=2964700 RepID=UPI00286E5D16|nr:hypothetical protein [Chamaesiphon sp. VAR_48_metabat_403]